MTSPLDHLISFTIVHEFPMLCEGNMALMKISNADLEKLRCQCGHYLSKPPIYTQSGQNLCSDCVDLLAPSPLKATRNTSLEVLASYVRFPCRYKLQGCPFYIEFKDVSNHEDGCSYRSYSCLLKQQSSCEWRGTIAELCQHYENQHPELCPTSSSIKVRLDKDYQTYYVIRIDDVPFLFNVKCETEKDTLWFNLICFATASEADLVNYSIKLSNETTTKLSLTLEGAKPLTFSSMEGKSSLHVNIPNIMGILQSVEFVDCSWAVNVTEEFRNALKREKRSVYELEKENTKCFGCGIYTVPPISRCEEGHVICVDCRGYFDECKMCSKNNVQFVTATELEEIAKHGYFKCKWPNCNEHFPSTEIRQHERTCANRVYKCPECNAWSGLQDYIEIHFKSVHKKFYFYVCNALSFEGICDVIYLFARNEIFKLNISNATMHYFGSPRFADMWQCNIITESQMSHPFCRNSCNQFVHKTGFIFGNKKQYQICIKAEHN